MMLSVVLLLASLTCGVGSLVLSPSVLTQGVTESIYVSSVGAGDVNSIVLASADDTVVLSAYPSTASPSLYMLAVPTNTAVGQYKVQARDSSAAVLQSVDVNIIAQGALILLENDKSLYKPGQRAQFRGVVVTLSDRKPLSARSVRFSISSPNGYVLLQETATSDTYGVVRFEFPIASQTLLGQYTARAEVLGDDSPGATHEVNFGVDEYVLPRYEVTASVHNNFVVAQTPADGSTEVTITGVLSAMYTYGQPVRASQVNVSVLVENQMFAWGGGGAWGPAVDMVVSEPSPTESSFTVLATMALSSEKLASGLENCDFQMAVERSKLRGGSPLTIDVSVEDAATGERQTGTTSLPVAFDSRGLQVHLSAVGGGDAQFKPGLPLSVQVEIFTADGVAATTAHLTNAGIAELKLIGSAQVVDYEQRPADVVIPIPASSFGNGVAVVSHSTAVEDEECCKPLAASTTWDEYRRNTGCCISVFNWRLEDAQEVMLQAAEDHVSNLCMERAYSPTQQYIDLQFAANPTAGSTASVAMRTTVSMDGAEAPTKMEFMLLQGATLVDTGDIALTSSTTEGSAGSQHSLATFDVTLPASMAGESRVVALLHLPSGQIVTGSASADLSVNFPFDLGVSFIGNNVGENSEPEARPGETVTVESRVSPVDANSGTMVFLTGVDRSVELLGTRTSISEPNVLAGLSRAAGSEAPGVAPRAWRECYCYGHLAPLLSELGSLGLQLLPTDAQANCEGVPESLAPDVPYGEPLGQNCPRPLFTPGACGHGGHDVMFDMPMAAMGPEMEDAADDGGAGGGARSQDATTNIRVRRNFPETWLWTEVLVPAGEPLLEALQRVPDTITSWTLEAFASRPDVGIASTRASQSLRVFKPLFAELRLPFSAVRGEDMQLTIAVFNYMSSLQAVTLSLVLPPQLELTSDLDLSEPFNIEAQGSATVQVRVRPTEIGAFLLQVQAISTTTDGVTDAVEKSLLVKPEGFVVREVVNAVIQLHDGTSVQEENLQILVPEHAVQGSAIASVAAVGDIMGPTLQGLESLLAIPYGCGEQNMMTLAPNVYVGKYLQSVNRLSADIQQRITRNMLVGYGRQLTYQRTDGSFSAFGMQDDAGSTWLTAFTVRVFAEVASLGLTSIDPKVIADASGWLVSLLHASEHYFESSGAVIHQEMMGGIGNTGGHGGPIGFLGPPVSADKPPMSETDRKVALTSFVVIALSRAREVLSATQATTQIDNALTLASGFLTSATLSEQATYAKILRIYARVVAQDAQLVAADAIAEVLALASEGTGVLYWKAPCVAEVCSVSEVTALDIELTGYAVMILTSLGDLGEAFKGVRWMLEHRNAGGGFISTQDTVVALKALSEYATEVVGSSDMTLSLVADAGSSVDQSSISVDSSNFAVMQTLPVSPASGSSFAPGTTPSLQVTADGSGVALVSMNLQYNVLTVASSPCYAMEVSWQLTDGFVGTVIPCVHMLESCSRPDGSGMALMNVGLFTGYSAVTSSLQTLVDDGMIKRYELEDQKVVLYIDEIQTEVQCKPFQVVMDFDVIDLGPAPSEVFEYYAPQFRADFLTQWDTKTETSLTTTAAAPPTTSVANRSSGAASRTFLWPLSCLFLLALRILL